ncbi:choice-of-anchor J domain-containing protein [Nonlabens ulvanivorans]|uniref:choice-of-anchor J domain-containing protein n=1 Tax=Nonlabens ulvanivorans TaxID=906888 RepID=UPI0037C8F594
MLKKLLSIALLFTVALASAQCNYSLEMRDAFGDGWGNGAQITVTINGTPAVYTVPNPPGNQNTVSLTVNDGDTLVLDYIADAVTPGDNEFTLFDSEGIIVIDSGFSPATGNYFNGSASCPTCPAVTTITVNNVVADAAEIGWTQVGTEVEWEIEVGPVGFTVGSGVVTTATTNPATVNGLSAITNYDVYVRAKCSATDLSNSQGPASFTTTESCPTPSNFAPVTQTATSVSFIWDANGNPSTIADIEYGPAGFTQGSGTMVQQFTAPFADVTGLAANTTYDFYVRIDCGMGDLSLWAGPYTATTAQSCPDISGITFSNVSQTSVDVAWTAGGTETEWSIEFGPAGFVAGTGTTVTSMTNNPFTLTGLSSGVNYDVCVTAVCGPMDLSTPVCASVLTPADYCAGDLLVDSGGVAGDYGASENFTYTVCPDNAGDVVYVDFTAFELETSFAGCWDSLTVYDGPDTLSPTINPPGGGTEWCWDAGSGTGDLVQELLIGKLPSGCLTFVFESDGGGQRAGFEAAVTCAAPPTCPVVFGQMIDLSSATSLDLSWTAGGTETEWRVEYGAPGFAIGSGTLVTPNPTMASTSITGLTSDTAYEFYITALCGPGDESIPVSLTGSTTKDYCAGDAFTDAGGTTAGYNASENTTYTICPDNAGDVVYVDFTAFDTEEREFSNDCYDGLTIYAGPDDTFPVISPPNGVGDVWCWDPASTAAFQGTGDLTQVMLIGALPSGCITFVFTSDGSVQESGWEAAVTCAAPPACPVPSAFAVDSSTSDTINLSWTVGSTETEWDIEYGPVGFVPGTGTVVTVTTNPYAVSGLTENTEYDFYITGNCSATNVSAQVGPLAGRTTCLAFTVPFSEGFNSSSSTQDCWTVVDANGDGDAWDMDYASNPSEGDEVAAISTDFNGGADDDYLISPAITLTGNERVRYDYRVQSAGEPNDMEVLISTATNAPADFTTQLLPVTNFANVTYMTESIDLSAYTGDVYIAWRIPPGTTDGWRMYIDNVRFETIPNCDEPLMLSTSNITTTDVDIAWTEQGASTAWEIEYGAVGFLPGTGVGTIVSATTNPFTLTGLSPNQCFDYYVRSVCSTTGFSPWSSTGTFCTACVAFNVPFQEGFNTASTTEQCWTVLDANGDGDQWNIDYSTNPFEGDQVAAITTDFNGGADDDYLISPQLNLTGAQRLKYQYRVQSAGEPNNMEVLLSTTGSNAPDFTNTLLPTTLFSNVTYVEEIIDLSAYTGPVYIAFRIPPSTTDGWRMYIDDVIVEDQPTCPDPLMVAIDSFTNDSATVSWTAEPLATAVNIEYGPCGFTPGTGTTVVATGNPYTITGLTDNTCYDVYVTFDCSGAPSVASDVRTFTTVCNPLTAPYTEDFETFTTTTSGFPGAADFFNIENCWSAVNTASLGWVAAPSTLTASGGTGPAPAINTGNYMYVETSSGVPGEIAELYSPIVDISSLTNPALTFSYHMFGVNMGNLHVDVNDGTGFVNDVLVINGQQQTAEGDAYLNSTLGLTPFGGGTVQIRFRGERGAGFESDIAIDNFIIEEFTGCLSPNSLVLNSVTATGVDFGWNAGGTEAAWEYVVQAAGTGVPTVSGTPVTVTNAAESGLTAITMYEIYVRADCGMGNLSDWVGPLNFTTPCDVIPTPYGAISGAAGNDFTNFPGACWEEGDDTTVTVGPNGLNGAWQSDDYANVFGGANGSAAKINIWATGAINDWLVTPEFDLGAAGHNMSALFDIALTEFGDDTGIQTNLGSDDEVQFLISDDAGLTWTALQVWNSSSVISPTGQNIEIDLSAYSGVVKLAFWGTNGVTPDSEDNDFFVDNFTIDATASNGDAFAKAGLKLFPNPSTGIVNINGTVVIDSVTVTNLLGQQLKTIFVNNENAVIDISDLATGLYLFEIQSGSSSATRRVVKK